MYYHTDRLGSPVAITDRHGEPIARYAWDAYGRAMAGIFEPYNSVGFTGHLYDQATGLTYFGARWYDADTDKFLSRDPIQDGWNWYAYVGGDPVNFVDLWGVEATSEPTGSFLDRVQQSVRNAFKRIEDPELRNQRRIGWLSIGGGIGAVATGATQALAETLLTGEVSVFSVIQIVGGIKAVGIGLSLISGANQGKREEIDLGHFTP